jgi:hypothetical protein
MYSEAPKAIGCCTEHIANPVKRGELRSVELGRCRVVPIEELQRLLVRRVEAVDLRKGKANGPEIRPFGAFCEPYASHIRALLCGERNDGGARQCQPIKFARSIFVS